MSMRTHELHPTLVHLPLTLVPVAIGLDLVGRLTDSRGLMQAARRLMPAAAASAVVAGTAGYVAQGAVKADDHARDMLITHRNLNTALVGTVVILAGLRTRRERPGIGYLLAGLGGVATMMYTAYLGGKMVYSHGLGVQPGGVDLHHSPELRRGNLGTVGRQAAEHVSTGLKRAAHQAAEGKIAPMLRSEMKHAAHRQEAHTQPTPH